MTTQIADLIEAARKRQSEREAEKRRTEIVDLREVVEHTFTVALREALNVRYEHEGHGAKVLFDFEGEGWRLEYSPEIKPVPGEDDPYSRPAMWEATVAKATYKVRYYFSRSFEGDDRAEDSLLLVLGRRYDDIHGIEREPDTNEVPF